MTFKEKMLVVPVDGSDNSFKSIKYLSLMLNPEHFSKIGILHIVSPPPPFLVEESRKDKQMAKQLKKLLENSQTFSAETLTGAEKLLKERGFSQEQIIKSSIEKKTDVSRDICEWAENKMVDAVVLSSSGRSKLASLFMGENACKVLERSRAIPVWIVKGNVDKKGVMVCMDRSENALKAVDHAGFMLAGSDCPITLFHAKRGLRRLFPKAVFEAASGLEDAWRAKLDGDMTLVMEKAKKSLLDAGITPNRISINIQNGGLNAASDVVKMAKGSGAGTIVMGKCGTGGDKPYSMGGVARKVIELAENTTVWVVP